jgi:hypothetical protein
MEAAEECADASHEAGTILFTILSSVLNTFDRGKSSKRRVFWGIQSCGGTN